MRALSVKGALLFRVTQGQKGLASRPEEDVNVQAMVKDGPDQLKHQRLRLSLHYFSQQRNRNGNLRACSSQGTTY